jgi:hypothetical protein
MSSINFNSSFGNVCRATEFDEIGQSEPISDAPQNELKAADADHGKTLDSGLAAHLSAQLSFTGAQEEELGSQSASGWLLNEGKLNLAETATLEQGSVLTTQAAADDSPSKQNFVGGPPAPSPLGPTYGGSIGGSFDANFGNPQLGLQQAYQAARNAYDNWQQGQSNQMGQPPQDGPPGQELFPASGNQPPSSQGDLGDFPEQSGPESTAGDQDPSTPEDPGNAGDTGSAGDPNGPVGLAYNPEGDYSGGGSLPGVIGPGVASFDPEGAGNADAVELPGFKDPRGGIGTPNPDGSGPIGPASLGSTICPTMN